jgi:hypothetical protein
MMSIPSAARLPHLVSSKFYARIILCDFLDYIHMVKSTPSIRARTPCAVRGG